MIIEPFNLILPALMLTLFTAFLSRPFLFPLYGYRFGFIFSLPCYLIPYRYLI
nr:MAG TPA: hypothetical protein [Caudoviricetes sp.]